MSGIKVSDLAYCRLQVSDLDQQARFLTDFGLVAAGESPGKRYFRSSDPTPYCYVAEQGEPRFLGYGFHAGSREKLEAFAAQHGLPIEPIDAPGGGWRARLRDPLGYEVDVVHGIEAVPPIALSRQDNNSGAQPLRRKGELFRLKKGEPTPVKRLAHIVLGTPDVAGTRRWFETVLGLIASDEIIGGPDRRQVGVFMRLNGGDDYVDHHTVFLSFSPLPGMHHISFESQDIDAVLADHHLLRSLGRYEHAWGVGRHTLGSQIFDYWADPQGYLHEHWADSDRLNASTPTNVWEAHMAMVTQWGDEAPERVRHAVLP